ncbi:MAG: immunoglobulin domain-containing protein [Limisphaerales bacterium]
MTPIPSFAGTPFILLRAVVLAVLFLAGLRTAANPVPIADAFALRGQITGVSGSGDGANTGASTEPGEPVHGGFPVGRTVWVSWVAPAHGLATVSTDGSKFDTVLAVYADEVALRGGNPNNPPPAGPFARLREVAVNDDADEQDALYSRVEFPARVGVRYEIMVAGYAGAGGEINLAWELQETGYPLPVLLHRETDRTVTNGAPVTFAFEVLAPSAVGLQWLRQGAPLPGATQAALTLPAAGTNDVGRYALRVTSPSPDPDDSDVTVFFSRTLELQLGPANRLARDKILGWSESGHTGSLGLHEAAGGRRGPTLQVPLPPPVGPARGYTGTQVFDTTAARRDPGEPFHCGLEGGASYWYRYTPATAGELWFDTYGSAFDTVLAIYTYHPPLTGYGGLIPVVCNDDEPRANGRSRVVFPAAAGRDYIVVVDGKQAARGRVVLNWALSPPAPAAPAITRQPAAVTALRGQAAAFSVEATGTGLGYQWRRAGIPLPGATGRQYSLPSVTPADDALYDVLVRNAGGQVLSRPVRLHVAEPPTLVRHPGGHGVAAGGTLRLEVGAAGTPPLSYQWRFNGAPLAGMTNAALVRSPFAAALAGRYDVHVANAHGAVTSEGAAVTLALPAVGVMPPAIVAGPAAATVATVAAGGRVNLAVSATGTAPLRYQWFRNGAALAGATNQTLLLDRVAAAHAGAYHVVVQNAAGQAASAAAPVHVLATPVPQVVRLADGPAVAVVSTSGPAYTLEARSSPAAGAWMAVASQPGTGGVLTFTNVAGGGPRFFRVVVR